jgi:Spy/CpxP family protein refolding chaperone
MYAMRQIVKAVVVLVLVALIAAPLAAQEKGKKGRKRAPAQPGGPVAQIMKKLEPLDLTTEQKEKIKTILASYKPKLEKIAGTLKVTPEQRRAAAEARRAGQAEGKKDKELRKVASDAMKLSEDQIAAREKQRDLNRQLNKEIAEVLTAEQREKFGVKNPNAGAKKKPKK